MASPAAAARTLLAFLALNYHAAGSLGIATARTTLQSAGKRSAPEKLREKNAGLLERRNAELALSRRHLGRIPVSVPLPKTDKEAISSRDEVVRNTRVSKSASMNRARIGQAEPAIPIARHSA